MWKYLIVHSYYLCSVWQVILDSVKSSGKERREIPTQNTDQIEYATNLTIPEATRNILGMFTKPYIFVAIECYKINALYIRKYICLDFPHLDYKCV